MNLGEIRKIVIESRRSLISDKGQWRCHEAATRCAEFLRKENISVSVKHGIAIYKISFLADEIAKSGDAFNKEMASNLRLIFGPKRRYSVTHSWCEVGDIIIDCLPVIDLGCFQCSGPLMIYKKNELVSSNVRYLHCGFGFSLNKIRFVFVPNLSKRFFVIPFFIIPFWPRRLRI